jgi:hypothetical protein
MMKHRVRIHFFYYDDQTPVGVRENSVFSTYVKDGEVHNYQYTLTLTNPQITHLKGWLYDCGNPNTTFKRNAIISNLKVTFTPKSIEKTDTITLKQSKDLKKKLKNVPMVERFGETTFFL